MLFRYIYILMDSFCYHVHDGKIVVVVGLVNFFVMVEDKLFRLLTLNGAKAFCNEDGIVHTTEKKTTIFSILFVSIITSKNHFLWPLT